VKQLTKTSDNKEISRPNAIAFINLPTQYRCALSAQMTHDVVEWLRNQLYVSTRVLTHCVRGMGGSTLLALYTFSECLKSIDAMNRLREVKLKVSPPEYWQQDAKISMDIPSFDSLYYIAYSRLRT
jgi:predicted protein tyrosine phosphatase